jgi:D-3-phosphoglycerate dehydrogenase
MKIALLEPLAIPAAKLDSIKQTLTAQGHEFVAFSDRNESPAVLVERAQGADVVIITNMPFPGAVIEKLPQLKMISVAFTGYDHVDIESCKKHNIVVCNASGYSTYGVAELAVGLMIDVLRNISQCDRVTREGKTKDGLVGFDLHGKTVGIIGTGVIGAHAAKLLQAFDCTLLGYDVKENPQALKYGVKYVTLEELMKQSDIVTLHCLLIPSTKGLINRERLAMMKPGSYLINCARGPIVDTDALVEALKSGQLAGAGIDVFDIEPPLATSHPLFPLKNAVVTPHVAFATKEAFLRRADIVVNNIAAWVSGTPQNRVA